MDTTSGGGLLQSLLGTAPTISTSVNITMDDSTIIKLCAAILIVASVILLAHKLIK